jgi:hypothetical protein
MFAMEREMNVNKKVLKALDELNLLAEVESNEELTQLSPELLDELVKHNKQTDKTTRELVNAVFDSSLDELSRLFEENTISRDSKESMQHVTNGVKSITKLVSKALSNVKRLVGDDSASELMKKDSFMRFNNVLNKRFGRVKRFTTDQSKEGLKVSDTEFRSDPMSILAALKTFKGVSSDYYYEFLSMKNNLGGFWVGKDVINELNAYINLTHDSELENSSNHMSNERVRSLSRSMYRFMSVPYKNFLRVTKNNKTNLVKKVNCSIYALLMTSISRYSETEAHSNKKSNLRYFSDFINYLNEAIKEYAVVASSFKRFNDTIRYCEIMIQQIIHGIYHNRSAVGIKSLWNSEENNGLDTTYLVLNKQLKQYSLYPMSDLVKLDRLNLIGRGFDTLMMGNCPHTYFKINHPKGSCDVMHLPSPTVEYTPGCSLIQPSFRFLVNGESNTMEGTQTLIISTENPKQWLSSTRFTELFTFSKNQSSLAFVNFVMDFDQMAYEFNTISEFIQNTSKIILKSFLSTDMKRIEDKIKRGHSLDIFHHVWRLFYDSKESLTFNEKQELIHISIALHMILIYTSVNPKRFALINKDGLDRASTFTALFYLLLDFICSEDASEDLNVVSRIAFGETIVQRMRMPYQETCDVLFMVYNRLKSINPSQKKDIADSLTSYFETLVGVRLNDYSINL